MLPCGGHATVRFTPVPLTDGGHPATVEQKTLKEIPDAPERPTLTHFGVTAPQPPPAAPTERPTVTHWGVTVPQERLKGADAFDRFEQG